ncbi:MAG: formyltransferase family protein [Armatimonadota bacterium]
MLCSDPGHPVMPHLKLWSEELNEHEVEIVASKNELSGGDLLFLISCQEMIREATKSMYVHTLVIHASDVPKGRGFAPLNWQILEGQSEIVVTMMDAAAKVDSGDIYHQKTIFNEGHETFEEIFEKLFLAEIELMNFAVQNFDSLDPVRQDDSVESSYYPRRTSADSRVSVTKSLEEIFDLLRASDPDRYPLTFEHRGYVYSLKLEKLDRIELAPMAVVNDSADSLRPSQ